MVGALVTGALATGLACGLAKGVQESTSSELLRFDGLYLLF